MPSSASSGPDRVAEVLRVPQAQLAGRDQGVLQHLVRRHPGGDPLHRQAGGHPAHPAGHPDHEELVQVAGEDGHEPDPLQQRHVLVLGQFQHPLVEPEPASLALEVPVGRQIVGWTRPPYPPARCPRSSPPRPSDSSPRPNSCRHCPQCPAGQDTLSGCFHPHQRSVIVQFSTGHSPAKRYESRTRRAAAAAAGRTPQLTPAQRQAGQAVHGRGDQFAQARRGEPEGGAGQPAGGRHSASMATRSPILTRSPRPSEAPSSASACSTRSQSA